MVDILVFLLILVILFGLEPTRAFIFGAFGFIFWVIVAFVGIVLIADAFTDKRTPEQKRKDKEKEQRKKELEKTDPATAKALIIVGLFFALALAVIIIASSK